MTDVCRHWCVFAGVIGNMYISAGHFGEFFHPPLVCLMCSSGIDFLIWVVFPSLAMWMLLGSLTTQPRVGFFERERRDLQQFRKGTPLCYAFSDHLQDETRSPTSTTSAQQWDTKFSGFYILSRGADWNELVLTGFYTQEK